MTATTTERLTDGAGTNPSRGTAPIAANTLIRKGWLVGFDANGRVVPGGTIASGCVAGVGVASATYDNRTGSELGGAAGAVDVEIEFGVFGFLTKTGGGDDIAADDVGKVCYVVDNQTVALTNGADTLGIAGFITEVRNGFVYVYMGPHVAGLIVIAASEASQLDTAQADIVELQTDALTAQAMLPIPLTSFVDADGDPLAKFADGASTVPGFNLADGEAFGIRWNNHANPDEIQTQVALPQDLDDTAAMVVHYLASKTGNTLGDAVTFTSKAFFQTVGALHDADADAGGASSAMQGDAAAKTVQEETLSIAAGDVPAAPGSLSLTVQPTDGTLGTDDVILLAVWIEYTRKLLTA